MPQFNVIFYEKSDGSEPAKEFILSLSPKMRAKVLRTIELLANNGTDLREPYSKALGDGLFELRTKVATDISRVFYFFIIDHRIVLTNGFIKKTQKTPEAELIRARRYKTDFLTRKENI